MERKDCAENADVVKEVSCKNESLCCCNGENDEASQRPGPIVGVKLSVDEVLSKNMDVRTQADVAYKRCMRNDAYLGQLNFCGCHNYLGLQDSLWGYDGIRNEILEQQKPLFLQPQEGTKEIPVFDMEPLLDATERLLGTFENRRFKVEPGSKVCGNVQKIEARGPVWIWSLLAIAIPCDRTTSAVMVFDDFGTFGNENNNESDMIGYLDGVIREVAYGISLSGKDMHVSFDRIFIGSKYIFVEPEHFGCAVSCMFKLPFPLHCKQLEAPLIGANLLSLAEWEKKHGFLS